MIEIPLSPLVAALICMVVFYAFYKFGQVRGYNEGLQHGSIITVDLLRKNGYIGKDEEIRIKQPGDDIDE